jgi:hypothetical protein
MVAVRCGGGHCRDHRFCVGSAMSKPTRPTWEGIPETGLGADPSPGYDEYIERCIAYMDALEAENQRLEDEVRHVTVEREEFRKQCLEWSKMYREATVSEDTHE